MESETEATTRSSATVRRAERWSSSTGSGRIAATQPVARGRGSRPPDQARTASKRACPAAITSPMRMPTAAPEGPKPASTRTSTAISRTPISTSRLPASGR